MSDAVVEARGLTKYFGTKAAVDQLDLSVPQGQVFALLGRNGAGKTTTIRMLLGLLQPTRGASTVFGFDSHKLTPETKARVGYLAEGHHLYGWMRIRQLAGFTAQTHPRWDGTRFRNSLGYFGLDEEQRIKSLSKGQRAQVSLAICMACRPELLIMDDPTLGVDAAIRHDFLRGIVDLVTREQRTVLFSTHTLADVERIADRLCIIDNGVARIIASVAEFKAGIARYHLQFDGEAPRVLNIPRMVGSSVLKNELILTVVKPGEDIDHELAQLNARSCERAELTLEEAFVEYTSPNSNRALIFGMTEEGGPEK